MSHNRKFVPGTVCVIKGKIRYQGQAVRPLHNFTENLVIQSGMLEGAPFKWISVAYIVGLENSTPIYYNPAIDKKHKCVELKINLKMEVLQAACQLKANIFYEQKEEVTALRIATLRQIYYIADLEMLMDVCKKYKLKGLEYFQAERIKYRNIPNSDSEVEALGNLGLLKPEYKGQGLIEDLVDPLEGTSKTHKIYSDGGTVYSVRKS